MDCVRGKSIRLLFPCLLIAVWPELESTAEPKSFITEYERQILDEWCPLVDICAQNATSAVTRRNGPLDNRGYISCCGGCSCHSGCEDQLNCCYQDAQDQNDIIDDVTDDEYKGKQNKKRKCLPAHIGTPLDDEILPAYVTIVQPPEGGCVDSKPIRVLDDLLYPTCDDIDLTPWGPYYPAYSPTVGEVFKNVLCARCHGITDAEMFTPQLECKALDPTTREATSLAQQVQVFTTGILSENCVMIFTYENPYEISNRRCYSETIDTCNADNLDPEKIMDEFKTTVGDLKSHCEVGFESPTFRGTKVYKNVFCYFCDTRSFNSIPKCRPGVLPKSKIDFFTHMIDLKLVLTHKKSIAKEKQHQLCLESKDVTGEPKRCRDLSCPSGQVRSGDGDCIFVSQQWGPGGIMMDIKLTPVDQPRLIRSTRDPDNTKLRQAILTTSPWSVDWVIYKALSREDTNTCDEKAEIIVYMILQSTVKMPAQIYKNVQVTIGKPWTFEMNGQNITFNQSLLDYELTWDTLQPQWQESRLNDSQLDEKYDQCEKIVWKTVFKLARAFPTIGRITKLFFCEQIQLENEEYTLDAQTSLLLSNLTKRVLYKYEYERIIENEEYHIRVCAEDTLFGKRDSNEAVGLSVRTPTLFAIMSVVSVIEGINML